MDIENTPNKIIVHHSAASEPSPQFEAINMWHKERNFPLSRLGFYVGYHYVIEKNGDIRQARLDQEIGAHTIGENKTSIGICLVGDFDKEKPTQAQSITLGKLLVILCNTYKIATNDIYPHRAFADKSCYGLKLSDNWAQIVYINAVMSTLLK